MLWLGRITLVLVALEEGLPSSPVHYSLLEMEDFLLLF